MSRRRPISAAVTAIIVVLSLSTIAALPNKGIMANAEEESIEAALNHAVQTICVVSTHTDATVSMGGSIGKQLDGQPGDTNENDGKYTLKMKSNEPLCITVEVDMGSTVTAAVEGDSGCIIVSESESLKITIEKGGKTMVKKVLKLDKEIEEASLKDENQHKICATIE